MNCIHKVSSLQVLFGVFFLELVILRWSHALGEKTQSGTVGIDKSIWKLPDKNSEEVKDYEMVSKNFDIDRDEGSFEDQDSDNVADLFDNYHEPMAGGDIKKQNTPFKRGINEWRGQSERRKLLRHRNAKLGGESGDSLIGTIIDNPDRIQGPLKDLISKYSEAHKHMYNKYHRNGLNSLKAETKTTEKSNYSNSSDKYSVQKNKHRNKQDVVSNDEHLPGFHRMSSVLKSNDDDKTDDSNSVTFQFTPNNSKEIKNKTKSRISHNDETFKVRKRKKNHKIKEIPEYKLGGYFGEESSAKKESSEDIRRNYINRLIQFKPIDEYNASISENEHYANMSLINKGFLGAAEKKHFSLDDGELTKFKPKPSFDFGLKIIKPINTDPQKNNRILNNNENEVTEGIQSSLKSNWMPNNKNFSYGKFDNHDLKLETGTNESEAIQNILGNKSLGQGNPIESVVLSKSKHNENNQNADRHSYHELEIKNGLSEIPQNKDSLQPTTQRAEGKLHFKVESQDKLHPKKASHILSKNNEKQNILLNNNEKRNKKRAHSKTATGYSLKQSNSLDLGIKHTHIAKKEVISKKNHLSRTNNHPNRRNERDVENKNPKLRKYRIGVDSRGRSRLMISDIDDYNNSGSFKKGSDNNKKGSNKINNMIGSNNVKKHQPQYDKESNEELEEEEVNYMQDNVGDKAYDDEANNNDDDNDEDDDVKKVFARRAHHSKYNDDEPSVTNSCVEYKGERFTSQTTRSTVLCPSTAEKTDTQSSSTKQISKAKTTPNTNEKVSGQFTQRTKSTTVDKEYVDNNSTSYKELDDYEQFLTGLFADNFINAVLAKVQRSRKMAKELGFGNDTDESCDRCLETKPNKMPDLDVLRKSLNSLPKSGQKKNSRLCYRVPEPMDDFLLSLISYEKEQESSVYRNIQDESSFIFTGDYPESSVREDKIFGNEKYSGEQDSIGKEAFEKQHLREEENEDKNDEQILSRNNGPLVHTLKPSNKLQEEESVDEIIDENEDSMFKGEPIKRKGKKLDRKNKMHSPLQHENVNGNDLVAVFDAHEAPASRSEYNHYIDPENILDTNNAKHRRQSYKSEKAPSLKRSDMKSVLNIKDHQNRVDTGEINHFPNVNYRIPNSDRDDRWNVQSNSHKEKQNFAKNNFLLSNANTRENHYAKPNEFYEYPQKGWAEREEIKPSVNKDHRYIISNDVLSNGYEEYQLYPNFNGDDIPSNYQYHKTDYGGNSRMVKRNAEPSYDDDLIFFEVPDIEYDLY